MYSIRSGKSGRSLCRNASPVNQLAPSEMDWVSIMDIDGSRDRSRFEGVSNLRGVIFPVEIVYGDGTGKLLAKMQSALFLYYFLHSPPWAPGLPRPCCAAAASPWRFVCGRRHLWRTANARGSTGREGRHVGYLKRQPLASYLDTTRPYRGPRTGCSPLHRVADRDALSY